MEAAELSLAEPSVLMYHHVTDTARLPQMDPYVVSPDRFSDQLAFIAKSSRPVVTLNACGRGSDTTARPVTLTFDDCPASLLESAMELLDRHRFRATLFAVSGHVGGFSAWESDPALRRIPLLGWNDLRQLAALGHEIGSHSVTHCNLRNLSRRKVLEELNASRLELEQKLGVAVKSVAYPYGHVPDDYRRLCKESGYDFAVSIFSTSNSVMSDRFAIRRILITERDVDARLAIKLSRLYLRARPRLIDRRVLKKTGTSPRGE